MENETPPDPFSVVEDTELVARSRKKDRLAYDELIRRYQSKIFGLVYNMTSNKEDAEDLVQDIFLKAYTSLDKFKGKSSFYTWIYRIGVNRTINFIKKRKKRFAQSLSDADSSAERDPAYIELTSKESPVRDASLSEVKQKMNEAIQKLSEKHRTVIVLHDVQGIPHEEIAKMLKCSQGTVRSRLFYARRQLQGELCEYAP